MSSEGPKIEDAASLREYLEARTSTQRDDDPRWGWLFRFIAAQDERRDWAETALLEMIESRCTDGVMQLDAVMRDLFVPVTRGRFFPIRTVLERELARDLAERSDEDVAWLLEKMIGLTDDLHAPLDAGAANHVATHGRRRGCFGPALTLLCWADWDRATAFVVQELGPAIARNEPNALGRVADELVLALHHAQQRQMLEQLCEQGPHLLADLRAELLDRSQQLSARELAGLLAIIDTHG